MRVYCLSAALCAAVASSAMAQSPAPAQATPATPAPITLTAKEIAELQAKLSSLDRQMGQEWRALNALNGSRGDPSQVNDMVNRMVKDGNLVFMRPLSPKHEALQIERAAVEAKLLAAGQKVRNMSTYAQQQYGVKQQQMH